MINLLQILFLVFGWNYNIKGLVITALIINVILMIITFFVSINNNNDEGFIFPMFIQIIILVLSITKLCIM